MIDKIITDIEETKISISAWLVSFTAIILIRILFESFSSPTNTGIITSDPYTIIHYLLFYLCVTLGTSLIVGYFTDKYVEAPKVLLFGLPLLWLAPLIDIILSHGKGYKMLYVFDTGEKLLVDFFTFFGGNPTYGVTYGMRIGIALTIFGISYYTWSKNKNYLQAILVGFFTYTLIFIIGSIPGIIYTVSHVTKTSTTNQEVVYYYKNIIENSTITHNTLREGRLSVSNGRFIEIGFNKLLTQILYILSCIFATILFFKVNSKKFFAVINNIRLERINFYIFSILSGVGFAYVNNLGGKFSWIDPLGVICLTFGWIGLWMNAVHSNDIEDLEIDKITNRNRPLVKKDLDATEMREVGKLWLLIGLLGSWSAGFYPFFMSLVYVGASHIYSSYPLRLRRYPMISSFLISIACLATILAGFFFLSINKNVLTFPPLLTIGILIIVTLAINFKDIKDVEGDKAGGIMTIPTLFPKLGTRIVAIMFAVSILLVPIFLSFYLIYIFALPCAIAGYMILVGKPYKEKNVFVLRFIFLACIATSYIFIYWLNNFTHI